MKITIDIEPNQVLRLGEVVNVARRAMDAKTIDACDDVVEALIGGLAEAKGVDKGAVVREMLGL